MLLDVPAPALRHAPELVPLQVEVGALLDAADDHEDRGPEAVGGEHLVGTAIRVEAPVIEGDQDRPVRKPRRVAREEAHILGDADRVKSGPSEHLHLLREDDP